MEFLIGMIVGIGLALGAPALYRYFKKRDDQKLRRIP